MADLWRLAAHELTQGFAEGRFTPVMALDSVLARCDAFNPVINAVIARDDAASRAMAAASSERWQKGRPLSPLDGVPVSVKDNLLMTGLPATWGTPSLRDNRPEADEMPVARLRAGGAVLFAKTNVPEFTVQGYTDNALFGPTGLPQAPALTPGGSSGGAAAAVAAGIGPLALCTDGGGSIRRPAAHAGLYGLKPGAGRIRRGGGFPPFLGQFEVVGPIGRDARDVAAMFGWLAGTGPVFSPAGAPRILYARHFGHQPVDIEILKLCDHAAEDLAAMGCDVAITDSFEATTRIDRIWPVISSVGIAWLLDNHPEILANAGANAQSMASAGRKLSASDYAEALIQLEEMRHDFDTAMAGRDLLMTPAIAALSWPKAETHPPVIAGQQVGGRGHAVFTAFANALGLPGLALPVGTTPDALPCGAQLIGGSGADENLLDLAIRWQARRPGFVFPCVK